MPNPLDINDVLKGQALSVKLESETREAAAAQRQEQAAEARHHRRIQFWTFMVTILLVLFAVFVCGDVILTGAPEDKKAAWPILGAMLSSFVSGLIGYAIGKKS